MDQMKYSIAVKLVGHEADAVQGYSVARYLVANEPIGRWIRSILEGNDNNWLLGIILRHPDVSERRSNTCLVRCGKHDHLLVTFNGANVPSRGALVPTVSIDLFLAMNHGGNFSDDKIQEFGVLRDGSLFDHIRSGIASGFNLGDLRLYVHPNVHCIPELYTDTIKNGRLVRFSFKPGSWDTGTCDVLIDDLDEYISNSNIVSFGSTPTPSVVTTKDQKPSGRRSKEKINKSDEKDAPVKVNRKFGEAKPTSTIAKTTRRAKKTKDLILNENIGKASETDLKGSTSAKYLDSFNPREYLLLFKAWKNELSLKDIKDTGKHFTEQDCHDAAMLLNDMTSLSHVEEPKR